MNILHALKIFDHTLILLLYTRYYVHLFQNIHIILLYTIITKEIQEILFEIHLNYISIRQFKDKGLNNNRTIKLNLNPCEISETELERHLHGSSISASSHRALFTSFFARKVCGAGELANHGFIARFPRQILIILKLKAGGGKLSPTMLDIWVNETFRQSAYFDKYLPKYPTI